MARSIADLATLIMFSASLAWTAPIGQAPLPREAEAPRSDWADEHHRANCSGRKVARIEELRAGDCLQQTLIDRGLVVYGAGYRDCSPAPRHLGVERGHAIWLCGNGFARNTIPGRSWCCKNCGERWGELEESLLDHP